ncbi:MAG: hypothetical protein Q9213_006106 [Squamulea squamosa]
MSLSATPTGADDEIRRITLDLSAKWSLRFPQPGLRSPAKRNNENPEEQVLSRLRYLYFRNRNALNQAIDCFERIAPELLAGWIVKNHAEPDVLPSRTRSGAARQDNYLFKRPALNDKQASDLMQALLRYLIEAVENVRKDPIVQVDQGWQQGNADASAERTSPQNQDTKPLRRSSRTSTDKAKRKPLIQPKDGNIMDYMKQRSKENLQSFDPHLNKIPQSSSDDYRVDDELFAGVEMQDAPGTVPQQIPLNVTNNVSNLTMASSESNESFDEIYQTPPDSPSKVIMTSRIVSMKTHGRSPTVNPVQTGDYRGFSESTLGQGRKRTYTALSKPDMPRKMSRDNSNGRNFNATSGQPFDAMTNIAPYPHDTRGKDRTYGDPLHRSFSSGSFTSVTSSGATLASSAWTTPNTSFMNGTPESSFDSSNEPFELDEFGGKSMRTRQSWQNLKEPFGLGLDMGLDPSMHSSAKAVSMGPPALIPMSRNMPEVSVKELLSVSPFGKF